MTLNVINCLENVDKNSEFLIIIIGVIAVLLVLIFIINFLGSHKAKSTKRLQRLNKKKLFKEIEEESKNIDVSDYKSSKQKTIEKPEKVVEEKIEVKNSLPTPEKIEKIDQINQIEQIKQNDEEEIIEVIQDEDESDVDRILRDIKAASKEETMNLTEFEREQEETAIISYDELCRKAGVQKKVYKPQPKEEAVQKAVEKIIEDKPKGKYTPTQFVSPIFGVQNEKKAFIDVSSEEDLDKTFLQNLKEFRSGLE